jgi:hypothetical protein
MIEIFLLYIVLLNVGLLGYENNKLIDLKINSFTFSITLPQYISVMLYLWSGIQYPFIGYSGIAVRLYKLIKS